MLDSRDYEVAYDLSDELYRYKKSARKSLSSDAIELIDELLHVLAGGHAAVLLPASRAIAPEEVFGRVNISKWVARKFGQYIRGIDRRILLQGLEPTYEINLDCADLFDANYLVIDRLLRELSEDVLKMPLVGAQSISQEYEFICDLLFLIRQSRGAKKYMCCKGCFREIKKGEYCSLHKSGNPDHYKDVTKISKFLSADDCNNLGRLKSIREVVGESVTVVSRKNPHAEPELNSILVSEALYKLLSPREDLPWKDAGAQIEFLLANCCPKVYEIVKGLAAITDDFPGYVDLCYSSKYLNNPNDMSRSSLWFWVTVFDAEAYFRAIEASKQVSDGRRVDTEERDSLIMSLHREGKSIREIENHLKSAKVRVAGRTTINKVIKSMQA